MLKTAYEHSRACLLFRLVTYVTCNSDTILVGAQHRSSATLPGKEAWEWAGVLVSLTCWWRGVREKLKQADTRCRYATLDVARVCETKSIGETPFMLRVIL